MRQARVQRPVARRSSPADDELPASSTRYDRVDTETDEVLRHIDAVLA
jgi:hypothetical protein